MDTNKEIDEFFKDLEEFENRPNLRLLIEDLDISNYNYNGSETMHIKPVYSSSNVTENIIIKKYIKKSNNNLF